MLNIQRVSVNPSSSTRVPGPGRYFRVLSANADLRIKFVFEHEVIETEIPAGLGVPFDDAFKEAWITTTGEAEQVRILVHGRPVDDDRVLGNLDVEGMVTFKSIIEGGVDVNGGHITVDSGNVTVDGGVTVNSGNVTVDGAVSVNGAVSVDGGMVSTAGCSVLTTGVITVGTTAKLVASANSFRRSVLITSDGPFWVGGAGVTASNGFPVSGSITLETAAAVYAIADQSIKINRLEEFN